MNFFTADFCDEHPEIVDVLSYDFKNYGGASKCRGEVITIKLDKNNSELIKLLRDEDGTGKIVVVDVEAEFFAVVGENLMKFAQQNNYSGIIVNGYIRDTFQIKDIPVALYALGTCPRKYIPLTEGIRDISLSFGGVNFKNGDYVYADTDGVMVTHKPLHN
ncbi:MAG: ribonuclease E activity regulator RraA [Helicobacteraceae bacterium]|nr:ribonuclease E activity regulator RraA [Candidatus Sulfurimonas ponti]MBL6972815.1 ribonuclease E activity regulator RraA [Sulfurimonas sp.]